MKTYALSATLTLACTPPSNTYLLPTTLAPLRRARPLSASPLVAYETLATLEQVLWLGNYT